MITNKCLDRSGLTLQFIFVACLTFGKINIPFYTCFHKIELEIIDFSANYAYHQFIFESGLTECVEEIPMENSNVTNGNSRSSPPSTPQSPSVLPPPPSPEEKSLPINAKRKNSIKNGIESVKRSKALTAPEVSGEFKFNFLNFVIVCDVHSMQKSSIRKRNRYHQYWTNYVVHHHQHYYHHHYHQSRKTRISIFIAITRATHSNVCCAIVPK